MTIVSMLPTPPNSPPPSTRKPVVFCDATVTALPTTLPSQPVKDAQALSQPEITSAAKATPSTTTRSTRQTITTRSPAARNLPLRDLATLRRDLHIDGWRCGAQTLKNTECKRWIIDANRNLIDAQLESMRGLERVSPKFESTVLKLIMLVHCHQHDANRSKERRLEVWRLAFPLGNTDGSVDEIPVERLIRKALEPLSVRCIARDDGRACKGMLGGRKVLNCEKTLQELIKQETYSNDAKLEFLLKVLEWNRTCDTHQGSRQFTSVVAWKKSVVSVLPLPKSLCDRTLASSTQNKPLTSPIAQAGSLIATAPFITEKLTAPVSSSPRDPPGSTVGLDVDPALYWPEGYDSSPFQILAHAVHDAGLARSQNLIRAEISRLLDTDELQDGYIYAYEVEGNAGYVKIGYTARTVAERHGEWSFNCNRQTKSLYPSSDQDTVAAVKVPHAHRVEALCHAELDHRRIRIDCGACLKQHIEWFEVSAEEVTAVIQKWSTWMATQPYESRGLRDKSKWTLKASEVERTSRFEQFMREIALVPAPL